MNNRMGEMDKKMEEIKKIGNIEKKMGETGLQIGDIEKKMGEMGN